MQKLFTLVFALSISCGIHCQNLVPNPSFESFDECPIEFGSFNGFLQDWVTTSVSGQAGTPDFYSACNTDECSVDVPSNRSADFAPAHSGQGYAGLFTYYTGSANLEAREYMTVQLDQPLLPQVEYEVSLFAQRIEGSFYATPIGINLSQGFLEQNNDELIDIEPNVIESEVIIDTTWQQITATYVAEGGELYLTIGNFRSNFETALQSPGSFPTECNSLFTTSAAYYFIDDVSVSATLNTDFPVDRHEELSAYPNPCRDAFNIDLRAEQLPARLEVTDTSGRLLRSMYLIAEKSVISTAGLPQGTVILRLTDAQEASRNLRLAITR